MMNYQRGGSVATAIQNAVVPGSLQALATQNKLSIAETFVYADVVILVDVSGSMNTRDSRGGRSRYDVALEELAYLQRTMPGRIAVVAFSSTVEFVPGGQPPFLGSGTDLARALQFVRVADGTVRFVLISDGEPDSKVEALDVVRDFSSTIDVVYVGPESDLCSGRRFLEELARARRGQFVVADRAAELAARVERLLLTSRN